MYEPERFVNIKACTAVHQLNQTERGYIRAVWRWAKTRQQLVTELKKLKFCTYSTAVEYLRMTDYIDDEDMQMLKGEENHE